LSASFEAVVVGGGLLGSAIGYGLARLGLKCAILDEGDDALRAARGNFGLVWVQSKGVGKPVYADWTMQSARLWPEFAEELTARTNLDLSYSAPGGIDICLSDEELRDRAEKLAVLCGHQKGGFQYQMLDRQDLLERLPKLGTEVVGGSFSPHDGHVSPLYLMRAMQRSFKDAGGEIRPAARLEAITQNGDGFSCRTAQGTMTASRVVLAAGLGNRDLAPLVGLAQPVHPVKGQVLVTQRMAPFLDLPTTRIRQTGEGSVLLGDSHEDAGFDVRSTPGIMQKIAQRARRTFPDLAKSRIVRTWGALRVMTPDGLPIYDQSQTMPGAFAAACHSGVTLARRPRLDLGQIRGRGQAGRRTCGPERGKIRCLDD